MTTPPNPPERAELAEKLHELANLLPQDGYFNVSATWPARGGTLWTMSTTPTDDDTPPEEA